MIGRYLLLSGVPVNQTTMITEINKLMQFLYEQIENKMAYVSKPKILESLNIEPWTCFEFVTKRTGAEGPSKAECLGYYSKLMN